MGVMSVWPARARGGGAPDGSLGLSRGSSPFGRPKTGLPIPASAAPVFFLSRGCRALPGSRLHFEADVLAVLVGQLAEGFLGLLPRGEAAHGATLKRQARVNKLVRPAPCAAEYHVAYLFPSLPSASPWIVRTHVR
jgi:hypothetical protein